LSFAKIDSAKLSAMIIAGADNLNNNKEYINELNVFPVPDGDTGTNMSLTIMAAADEIRKNGSMNMSALSKCVSQGSLRGARGNSGVILSQLLRGFCKVIAEHEQLDTVIIANATVRAVETAYKAVMRPKEGTILTVAKAISDKASQICKKQTDLKVFFDDVLEHGNETLQKTPEMLPVLKEAGVVDAGGQGLLEFLKGALFEFNNEASQVSFKPAGTTPAKELPRSESTEDIKFGYCTEFIINLNRNFNEDDENKFKVFLEGIGDSIVCVSLEDIVKVHVHTNDPGVAISKALTYGELTNLKIDNMREEHRERLFNISSENAAKEDVPQTKTTFEKKYGFIAVSIGTGFNDLFTALGCDHMIEGGQTMNPSTNDIINAIEQVDAENIFVLPNNKNIILAANQAGELIEDKNIIVIPTTTIPQGITAMLNFDPDSGLTDNTDNLNEAIKNIKTGEITYSVRDTVIDERIIHKDDYMGITEQGIIANGTDLMEVTLETIDTISRDSSLISVYYGEDATSLQIETLEHTLSNLYPECEISIIPGGQPVYYFIVSAE